MDERSAIVLFVLEWVWLPMGAVVLWSIRRIFGLERSRSVVHTELAVLKSTQKQLADDMRRVDERNNEDHGRIETKIDRHHSSAMKRLDSLLTIAQNGQK
jgi:hypothetical protein